MGKFEKFIEENEAKRRRAIQKYQSEVKLKDQKNRELEALTMELNQLKARSVKCETIIKCTNNKKNH